MYTFSIKGGGNNLLHENTPQGAPRRNVRRQRRVLWGRGVAGLLRRQFGPARQQLFELLDSDVEEAHQFFVQFLVGCGDE